jgi:hypothetical protein
MRRPGKMFAVAMLAAGLWTLPSSECRAAGYAAYEHGGEYGDLRGLVDRTQSDLRAATELAHGNKQNDRYHKAQDHLSKLDRSLSHGKYNKGALNDSIDGVKSILDHNTLQASARDSLMRDLTDLKIARDRH